MPPTLFLLDGHAIAYRAYYALTRGGSSPQGWTTREGEPTAGVYGFASVLLRILSQDKPDYLAVAFDTGKTFRDELYSEYKATRAKMPDDLVPQIKRIRQLVDAFQIPRLEQDGYEADDVLGSLAKKAVEAGLGVKIITGDRDLLQLVDARVIVSLPGKTMADAKDFRSEDVMEFLGVKPMQVVDYKALVGDKSDNIPGVPGVGEKTATSLLAEYGTLDGIYANLMKISTTLSKKLEAGKESAYLSQRLARIVTELEVSLDLEKASTQNFDPKPVEALFRQLEFRTLLNRLTELTKVTVSLTPRNQQLSFLTEPKIPLASKMVSGRLNVRIIDTYEKLQALVIRLLASRQIAIDTETTSTNQMEGSLVGISLAVEEGEAYYIPIGHETKDHHQLPMEVVLDALRLPLTRADIPKVGHNVKYDYVILARHGLRVAPFTFDTMIAEWLVNPNSHNLGLKNLAWVRLNIKMTEIEELIGKGRNQRGIQEVAISTVADYAAEDAEVVFQLMPLLQRELEQCQAVQLFTEIEMPLVPILAEMEMTGVRLDIEFLMHLSNELSQQLGNIERNIYQAVGKQFNLNSPQQLSSALFDRLGLEPPDRRQRTSTGFYSTAAGILEEMRGAHPVVDLILEYRELSKLKSTYVDALPTQVNPHTGRVHTNFNQTGSVTGRLASSDPNLQNIPIRTEIGREVRRAFIASPGCLLLSVDYSQVELRIVAHMADDQNMLASFQAEKDIHTATAAAIYGVPFEVVTSEQRRYAKGINFGLIYGMSPYGLSRATELTLAEAEDFVRAYFRQFPGVKRFLDGMRYTAAEQGYVETLLGRRRYFPALKSQTNANIRNREEREAINAPIQGTAADIIKTAMLRIPTALAKAGLSGKMLLQVHDELVFEAPTEEISETAALVSEVMVTAYPLKASLKTDARAGPNWYEMELVL